MEPKGYLPQKDIEGENTLSRAELLNLQSSRRIYIHNDIVDPEAQYTRVEALRIISQVIQQELTDRERMFIQLRYYYNAAIKEIAKQFNATHARIGQYVSIKSMV